MHEVGPSRAGANHSAPNGLDPVSHHGGVGYPWVCPRDPGENSEHPVGHRLVSSGGPSAQPFTPPPDLSPQTRAAPTPQPAPQPGAREWQWWLIASAFGAVAIASVFAAVSMQMICDDAYITFRYVSNAHDGHGLVWNPPPFEPVEGYTSWLWAVLLWCVWSWFGVEPPDCANALTITFGVLQLAVLLVAGLALRNRKNGVLPLAVLVCMLLAVVSNRTFLRWMTGGLETSLFNSGWWRGSWLRSAVLHVARRCGCSLGRCLPCCRR